MRFRIFCLFFSLCCCVLVHAQQQYQFNVKSYTLRLKNLDGSFGEWKEMGAFNQDMKIDFTIDFLSKEIIWVNQFRNEERKEHIDKIINISADYTYKDFGVWAMKFATISLNKIEQTSIILFQKIGSHTYCTMIRGEGSFMEEKYELEQIY